MPHTSSGGDSVSCRRFFSVLCLLLTPMLWAAESDGPSTVYQVPPKTIAKLVDAPRFPGSSLSPDKGWLLMRARQSVPGIAELAQPELRLAGLRFNPKNHAPSKPGRFDKGYSLMNLATGKETSINGLPEALFDAARWSPNSKYVAFLAVHDDSIGLWVIDVATAKARPLIKSGINGVMRGPFYRWHPDGDSLVCTIRPDNLNAAPQQNAAPSGPNVQVASGKKAPVRTFQDLLANPHDENLFSYHASSELSKVSLSGEQTSIIKQGLIDDFDYSPDGRFLLVEQFKRPFSYIVPARRFPKSIEVFNGSGKKVHTVAELPLAEDIPKGFAAVRTGPRDVSWRPDKAATLTWVETQDDGNPMAKVKVRDKVFSLAAPFKRKPKLLADLQLRYGGIAWTNDGRGLASEWWWSNRKVRTWVIDGKGKKVARLLFERSFEDRYADPGNPVFTRNQRGAFVVHTVDNGQSVLMRGAGASPEGNRPFLQKVNLSSGELTEMWRSQAPYYEQVSAVLNDDATKLLTRRETKETPPNYYIRNRTNNQLNALTQFPHPTPELAGVSKELISYERADGVKLTGTLYLPPGYKAGDGPLPMIFWAYPQEYKSADAAGQVSDSPHRFVRISYWQALPFLSMGYAVLDDPSMPIIGEGDAEPNDTYVEQLVASAKAAIDEMVRRGVADPDRIAIGGHSYGAFMVANLLAHSDLFRTGIARSGAYNRTLTPFGFQAEERSFWEAQPVYARMSPFFHAEKINEPILFIHGEADSNSGTYPLQSERMFKAMKGLGGVARLVMFPHESHGYRARESLLHMLWEEYTWLEHHLAPRNTARASSQEETSGDMP